MLPLRAGLALLALGLVLMPAQTTRAQSPADEHARQAGERSRSLRLDRLGAAAPSAAAATGKLQTPDAGGPCFPVDHVGVEGAAALSRDLIEKTVAPFEGRCIGLAGINDVLRAVTGLYTGRGLVTSRVYVPEQDIGATRRLRLVAVEGLLEDIYVDGRPAPGSGPIATAFPGMKGRRVNIRDIEQGLDQINRLRSNDASTVMLPGTAEGASILDVRNAPGRPWRLTLSNSNLGQDQTGRSRNGAYLSADSLFGINDLVSLAYERTGPDFPWHSHGSGHSNSYSGSLSLPYGYWTVTGSGSWYNYKSRVAGSFSDLETSGTSGQAGLSVERVLLRDQNAITLLSGGLTYSETDNFLLGNRIEVGSRQYTTGSLGLTQTRRMYGGVWIFDALIEQGLDLFGAVGPDDPGAGGADPRFTKISGTIRLRQPTTLGPLSLEIETLLSGQYSPDQLFGAEQMALGSYTGVRGARESLIFGRSGAFTRNDIVLKTRPFAGTALDRHLGELRPYAGFDFGYVFADTEAGQAGGNLSSFTLGVRSAGELLSIDFGYSGILGSSVQEPGGGLLFLSSSLHW